MSTNSESLPHADMRTLSLATPEVTPELVEKLIQFQRTFVDKLSQVPAAVRQGAAWESWQARAHLDALAASGLEQKVLSRLASLCADFCSARRTQRELQQKRDAFAAKQGDPEILAELDKALTRHLSGDRLKGRYGKDALAPLEAREDELLALHAQLWAP